MHRGHTVALVQHHHMSVHHDISICHYTMLAVVFGHLRLQVLRYMLSVILQALLSQGAFCAVSRPHYAGVCAAISHYRQAGFGPTSSSSATIRPQLTMKPGTPPVSHASCRAPRNRARCG